MGKAIFIRNPKCATISIRDVILRNNLDILFDETEAHQRAEQWAEQLSDYKDCFVFSICRNPYSRIVSGWFFIVRRRLEQHQKIIDRYQGNFSKFVLNLKEDFGMNLEDLDMVTWPQTRWFLDKSGNDIVNEIGRIERINPWWKKLCKDQGWPETPLKKRNATNHKPWREYYTPDMADIINREYAADFEFLKYKKLFTS